MSLLDIARLGIEIDARQVRDGDRALDDFTRTGARAEGAADRTGAAMQRMARMAATVAAAIAANKVIEYADAWANLQGKLALVTNSQRELAQVTEALYQSAQRTRTGLEVTADLYASLTRSTKELNKTDAERLAVTETINKALVVSGTSAQGAEGALRQLNQAFASGVLRGDEFNSVMEASPRLVEAIGAGMGKTMGEMRALAAEGKLTSTAIFSALQSQGAAISAEFDKMPKTVGQAMTQVQNALLRSVGMFDQQNQLSRGLAESISVLASNMGTLIAAASGLAVAMGAKWIIESVIAIRARMAATAAATAADNAAAVVAARLGVVQSAAATNAANAELMRARAAYASATGLARLSVAMNVLAPAEARATAAATAHVAAQNALAGAATRAAATTTLASRALGLLGGPIGWITTLLGLGATAWMMWGNKADEAEGKAAQAVEKSTNEIVEDLDKQISKLKERNALAKVAPDVAKADSEASRRAAAIQKEIDEANSGNGRYAGKAEWERSLAVINLTEQLNPLIAKTRELAAAQADSDAKLAGNKMSDWLDKNSQYRTPMEKLAEAIAKAKTELGAAFTPEIEARIRKTFAAADTKKLDDAAKTAAKTAREYIDGLKEQAAALGATESQQLMLNAARAAEKAPTPDLRMSIMQNALALVQETEAQTELARVKESAKTNSEGLAAARGQEYLAAWNAVAAMQTEIDTYGMGAEAVTRYTIAKLKAKEVDQMMTADEGGAAHTRSLIAAQEAMLVLQGQKDTLDTMFETSKVETFGDALRDAFGNAGSALGKLSDLLGDYNDDSSKFEKARADATKKYSGDEVKTAKAIAKINDAQFKERVGAYADMAGAAKGFFKENTTGYKLLEGAERGFRLMEMAMQMESLYTHLFVTGAKATATATGQATETGAVVAGEAARNAAKVPGVFMSFMSALGPWGMAAAAVAIAAVLGGAFSGGGGGASTKVTAEDRQKTQNRGTVLGDSSAQSESMANSLETMEKYAELELGYQNSMLNALRNIETALGSAAKGVLQTAGITGGSAFGTTQYKDENTFSASKSREITDSGVKLSGTFGQLRAGQGSGRQYEDVFTQSDGGMFRSGWERADTNYKNLSAEAMRPFAQIYDNMGNLMIEAGTKLGYDAAYLTNAIDNTAIDFGVSLRGLAGDDLTAAINAGVSASFDKVATQLFPFVEKYQKVGEGLGETLVRMAADVSAVDSVFAAMGKTANISVEAKEILVQASGGLEKFADSAASFVSNFYSDAEQVAMQRARLAPVLQSVGLSTEGANAQKMFRDLVVGLDTSTAAGTKTYAMLMEVQQAFYDVTSAAADERADLQEQLDDLILSTAEKAAKARAALDPMNRVMYDQVQAAQAARDAHDEARDSLQSLADEYRGFAKSLEAFGLSLVTGNLSTLNIAGQEAAARAEYEKTAKAALAGDKAALSNFEKVAQQFLTISQKANGGDSKYMSDYANVLAMTDKLASYATDRADLAMMQLDVAERSAKGIEELVAIMRGSEARLADLAVKPPDQTANESSVSAYTRDLYNNMGALLDGVKQNGSEMFELTQRLAAMQAQENNRVTLAAAERVAGAVERTAKNRPTANNTAATLDD